MAHMKKAVFFSIVSLSLILLFLTSAEIISQFEIKESEIEVTRTRVRLLNSIIGDMEQTYFDRLVQVSVKNSLHGISCYYAANHFNQFLIRDNLKKTINLTMYSGLFGVANLVDVDCMEAEYTIEGLTDRLIDIFERLGIDVKSFSVDIDQVNQHEPFYLEVVADISYDFADKTNIARWRGLTRRTVNVPLYGLHYNETGVINPDEWKATCHALSFKGKMEGRTIPTEQDCPSGLELGICIDDEEC